ncbi:hypothetical protein Tco_1405178 [Tanacetum coccineum]
MRGKVRPSRGYGGVDGGCGVAAAVGWCVVVKRMVEGAGCDKDGVGWWYGGEEGDEVAAGEVVMEMWCRGVVAATGG